MACRSALSFPILVSIGGCTSFDRNAGQVANAVAPPDAVTGQRSINLQSEQEEVRVAEQCLARLLADEKAAGTPVDADAVFVAKLQSMLNRITPVSHRPHLPWEVHLVENDTMNAYALGGGKVLFYAGITELAVNDDELAAVMAHEVAHNACAHRSETDAERRLVQASSRMSKNGKAAYFDAAYSTENEDEADRVGLLYMALAGYDPRAASAVWARAHHKFGSNPGAYLFSHSLHIDRARKTAQLSEIAVRYYVGPGQTNPQYERLRLENDLVPRAKASSGFAALLDALAVNLSQYATIQAEANARQQAARREQALRFLQISKARSANTRDGKLGLFADVTNSSNTTMKNVVVTFQYIDARNQVLFDEKVVVGEIRPASTQLVGTYQRRVAGSVRMAGVITDATY